MATPKRTPLLYSLDNPDNNKMATHSCLTELNSKNIKMMSSDYTEYRQFNDDRVVLKMDLPQLSSLCRCLVR